MNTEGTETRNNSSELYRHYGDPHGTAPAKRYFAGLHAPSRTEISSVSLLRAWPGGARALPEIDSQGAGPSRLSTWLDLQLRQTNTETAEDVHPFYGNSRKVGLQSRGNPALRHRWTLPGDTAGNRGLRKEFFTAFCQGVFNNEP